MAIIRATTPTHTFIFKDMNPAELSVLKVYYAQQGKEILEKEKDDFVFASKETEDATIYLAAVSLTQEETLLFNDRFDVEIQLRGLTENGAALATEKYQVSVIGVLNDEVLE